MNKTGPGYASESGLKKAGKKIESVLSESKPKAVEALRKVAGKYNLNFNETLPSPSPSKKIRKSFIETPDIVEQYFQLESVSRQLPGIKDFVNLKDTFGIKIKMQKRVMLVTVGEAYTGFVEMFPERKISSSKFHSLRPDHVIIASEAPHNICCCSYCENFQFIFDAISPYLIKTLQVETLKELLVKLVCCRDNYDCMSGKCLICSDWETKFKQMFIQNCGDINVKVSKWEKVEKFTQINWKSAKMKTVVLMFSESFQYFKIHKYLAKAQSMFLSHIKSNQSDSECAIIMDYSQNYAAVSQNEVQSAFFSRRQISVFTGFAYVGQKNPIPYIIVNDDIAHQKEQVWYYEKLIIEDVKKCHSTVETVRFMTDGCAAQFKNKFTLSNLLFAKKDFGVNAEWNFMPTSHGKSPVDGLGGSIKRGVYNRVLTGKFNVYNAKDFVKCAKTLPGNTKIIHVTREETEKFHEMLQKRWKNVKTIPGTRQFHHFTSANDDRREITAAVSSRLDGVKKFKV